MKVKLFTKLNPKNKAEPYNSDFETEINEWLQKNSGTKVHQIKQSAGGGSMGPFMCFISIWYE